MVTDIGSKPLGAPSAVRVYDAQEIRRALDATLADGGCRCIRVAPYANRAMDPLDPRFISEEGDLGRCRAVPKLRHGSAGGPPAVTSIHAENFIR